MWKYFKKVKQLLLDRELTRKHPIFVILIVFTISLLFSLFYLDYFWFCFIFVTVVSISFLAILDWVYLDPTNKLEKINKPIYSLIFISMVMFLLGRSLFEIIPKSTNLWYWEWLKYTFISIVILCFLPVDTAAKNADRLFVYLGNLFWKFKTSFCDLCNKNTKK